LAQKWFYQRKYSIVDQIRCAIKRTYKDQRWDYTREEIEAILQKEMEKIKKVQKNEYLKRFDETTKYVLPEVAKTDNAFLEKLNKFIEKEFLY
jgi:hypothetical protein